MSAISLTPLPDRAIYISGEEALSYLQGQLTQDLNTLSPNQWLWTGHCNAKGKLWGCFKLCHYQQGYLLIGSKAEVNASFTELKKYAVFSKVEITIAELEIIGGCDITNTLSQAILGEKLPQLHCKTFAQSVVLSISDNRLLIAKHPNDTLVSDYPADTTWQAQSILAGEPRFCQSAVGEYVPQMVNLQAIGGVSFSKGCYAGQETVARMKYLGKNKRAMFILSADTPTHLDEPSSEEEKSSPLDLEVQLGENWRRAGSIIYQYTHNNTLFALAVLPSDTNETSLLRAKHAPQVTFTIHPTPYSLTEE